MTIENRLRRKLNERKTLVGALNKSGDAQS